MERRYESACTSPRSRSAPKGGKSPRTPGTFYAFPATLQDILYGPRQRLTKYADGMRALPVSPSLPHPEKEKEEEKKTAVEEGVKEGAVVSTGDDKTNNGIAAADAGQPVEHASDVTAATPEGKAKESSTDREDQEEEVLLPGEESAVVITTSVSVPAPVDSTVAEEGEKGQEGAAEATKHNKTDVRDGEVANAGAAKEKEAEEENGAHAAAVETPVVEERVELPSTTQTAADAEDDKERAEEEPITELPPLRATAECIAFDPALAETWMKGCRHDTAHVPPGVNAFVRNFDKVASKFNLKITVSGGAAPSPLTAGAAATGKKKKGSINSFTSALGGSPMDMPSRDGSFGGLVALHPASSGGSNNNISGSAAPRKSNALEALGDVWEGRQEIPISLDQGVIRRRGLFGEVEKKKIHHMVVAVLNKVTTDPKKFREVKNELLRLPIPEANPEQLTKIVDAFFTKAVREQNFSHSYADLIVALCKVPQGQHIVGDKTQSLEYRLRVALLKRCQTEFLQSVRKESSNNSSQRVTDDVGTPVTAAIQNAEESTAETEKERRDRMCGNVRFVCELFLRDVVVGTVISFIFRVCLLGSEFGEFSMPPGYTPTESQVDEVITAIKTVKERYFVLNIEGRRMRPLVLGQLTYWMEHYPISRCRFLLMSIVEDLRAMQPPPEPTATPTLPLTVASSINSECTAPSTSVLPEVALVTRPGAVSSTTTRVSAPWELSESLSGNPSAAAAANTTDGLSSPMSSTMVGGQPLPAPRSKQAGNTSVSESMDSFTGTALVESAVGSPLLALALTLSSRALLQPVRSEAIAKFMAALSTGQSTPKEIAAQMFDQYGNVLPVLAAWMDRCLSVAKEEKPRKQTGAVLVACAEHLTAHLSPSSVEWAETMSACREQVHEVAIEALQRAVEGKLYEDLHIFQFWAQLILSDHDRVVYNEELLNEGLELVAYTASTALRNYLVEVCKYVNQALLKPESLPWNPATEAHNFVRFRPLLVLHSLVLSGGAQEAQEVLDNVLSFADVRQQCLEMRLYHAFRNGTPSHEVIFEQLRSAPRLTCRDPTLAAEVLSAMLIAELCSDGVALVENNMDLIQITVDGVNRAAREMALVAEVYEVLHYAPKTLPRTAAARVLRKFVFMHILSDETMERADLFYAAEREGVIGKADESRVLEPPPSTQGAAMASDEVMGVSTDLPRIADRHTREEVLSASTSLRSVGSNNIATANGNDHNYGGETHHSGSAAGTVVDFRAQTAGTNSVEGVPSSNASSLAELRSHNSDRPSWNAGRTNHSSGNRRKRHSSELSSLRSLRQTSPTRSHDDASKRLYRNTYKNRRRSHEGGSERVSSAGESKDVSPQQQPVAQAQSSAFDNSGLENSHVGSNTSRYGRSSGGHNHNNSSITSTGSRGGRGGHAERGGGSTRGGRGGRGGGGSSNPNRGGRGGRGGHEESRRGNGRYNSRGGGSNRE